MRNKEDEICVAVPMYWIICGCAVVVLGSACGPAPDNAATKPNGNLSEEGESTAAISVAPPILKVTVTGAKSNEGVYALAMFRNEEDFNARSNPVAATTLPITDPSTWEVPEVAPGEYALAVYHDKNENGQLDRHSLGFPTEAYGFSNNARGKFGPPSYAQTQFEIASEPIELSIKIQ